MRALIRARPVPGRAGRGGVLARAGAGGPNRATAVAAGLVLDRALGEPPSRVHPVALFGKGMEAFERRLFRDRRSAGVLHAAVGVGVGVAAGLLVRSPALGAYLAVAGRKLGEEALAVAAALDEGDLDRARRRLPALVGRDVERLDATGVARAAVESVAENTVDAVVAPALWAALAGAPGALGYRALNTLDAMVGHRDDRHARYGWASARLDDLAAYVPARVCAGLVALVRPHRAGAVWRAVREGAREHPSPNAGVAEAAFAGALGVRLGGPVSYGGRREERPVFGTGRPPQAVDVRRAVRLSFDVGAGLAALLVCARRGPR